MSRQQVHARKASIPPASDASETVKRMQSSKTVLVGSLLLTLSAICLFLIPTFQHIGPVEPAAIIPLPTSSEWIPGVCTLSSRSTVAVFPHDNWDHTVTAVVNRWSATTGLLTLTTASDGDADVSFHFQGDLPPEGYQLDIQPNFLHISCSTPAGAFYALQTISQLLPHTSWRYRGLRIPCGRVVDKPRFAWRGMMLDVARHMVSMTYLKKFLDTMATYKMNRFHFHLTDDQGWRLEIKKHPLLTRLGGFRKETVIQSSMRSRTRTFDGKRYGGFYTQNEIKELVAYAAERFITIIPEIEMPGHSSAILAAYPTLSCNVGPKEVATYWGVFNDVLCPYNATFTLLEDVLTEVFELFPSRYVHLGGDECPKAAWDNSSYCQQLIRTHKLLDGDGLQRWFMQRIIHFVRKANRTAVGWDELLEGHAGPPDGATIMVWRDQALTSLAARLRHDVVVVPKQYWYLDRVNRPTKEMKWMATLTLQDVYEFNPMPSNLSEHERTHIQGGQGNIWTEYIVNETMHSVMAFPRVLAIAERLWSPPSTKTTDFADFTLRLPKALQRLKRAGFSYWNDTAWSAAQAAAG